MLIHPESQIGDVQYWENFFNAQTGSGFAGMEYQRGGGAFGSFLKTLARVVMPTAARIIKGVGKEAITAGTSLAQDAHHGVDPVESLKKHGKKAGINMVKRATTFKKKKKKRVGKVMKGGGKAKKAYKRRGKKDIFSEIFNNGPA